MIIENRKKIGFFLQETKIFDNFVVKLDFRWVLLIRFVRFSIYLWVQGGSFWGSDAGIVTDETDSMQQRETKRWQNETH